MSRVVGLLGGTFDPVHNAHLHLARTALDVFGLDEVRLMPAAKPPHKPGAVITAATHRAAMCRLACEGESGLSVETIELDRTGPSFTIDTLRALDAREPGVTWRIIMGADMLDILHLWKNAAEVIRLGHPIIACRSGYRLDADNLRDTLDPSLSHAVETIVDGYLALPPLDISSTAVRERLADGRDVSAMLPHPVLEFIRTRHLYGA